MTASALTPAAASATAARSASLFATPVTRSSSSSAAAPRAQRSAARSARAQPPADGQARASFGRVASARARAAAPRSSVRMAAAAPTSQIGLVGLAVMGQNLALNVAEKGFNISVYNRSVSKTDATVLRAEKLGLSDKLHGFRDLKAFVASLERPRRVIILVKAGAPVDATIAGLVEAGLEAGDIVIDGGNEWYENTERRQAELAAKGIVEIGMGVSGGEEGARHGPAMMPGGDREAYTHLAPILEKVAAQTDDGACVTYVGPGGAGNFVKMVHNGIEYGDMQLIAEAYDVLRVAGGLSNAELAQAFAAWNAGDLESFLVEITSIILKVKDDQEGQGGDAASTAPSDDILLDKVLDKTGMKGTGKWTIQQAAELSVAAPTMEAALDARFLSGVKEQRVAAAGVYEKLGIPQPEASPAALSPAEKAALVEDVAQALYAAKICSYAQGYNIIRAKSEDQGWGVDLADLGRIWKGGCIIRAKFLDRIKQAYLRNKDLPNLLVDPDFSQHLAKAAPAWRRVVQLAVGKGIAVPGLTASLGYFDTYRRARLPANLVQAQRDFFGSHTYERTDKEGWFHTIWDPSFGSADSAITTGYNN